MQLQSKQQKEKSQESALSKDIINHRPIPRKTLSTSEKMDLLTACIDRIKSSKDAKNIKKSNDSKNSSNSKHNNHEIKLKSNNKSEVIVDSNVKEKKKRGRKKKIIS